jgi:YHS domain-containing protein
MKQLALAAVLVSTSAALLAGAAQTTEPMEALDGLDPVLLVQGKEVQGKPAFSVAHGRFAYLFSTAETKATFERDPSKYEIQMDGLCARMGKTAGGNPSDFLVYDGKIYIFGSDDCHKRFQQAPQKYLASPAAPFPQSANAAARGRDLLERVVAGIGRASTFDTIANYSESFEQVQKRPQGDVPVSIKTTWAFPDRIRQERTLSMQGKTMTSAMVMSPDGVWFVAGSGQVYPSIAAARVSVEADYGRHPVSLLRARRSAGFKAAALGASTVDGDKVQQVRVVNGPVDAIVNVDSRGRLHSISYQDRNIAGEYGAFTLLYSDFRKVGGLQLPFAVRGTFNGQPESSQTWTVTSIAFNQALDPSLFAPTAPKAPGTK